MLAYPDPMHDIASLALKFFRCLLRPIHDPVSYVKACPVTSTGPLASAILITASLLIRAY